MSWISHLAYPEILEAFHAKQHTPKSQTSSGSKAKDKNSKPKSTDESDKNSSSSGSGIDVYETWYPPMRHTLSLLSKLYGVVEMAVFEDFARRAVGAMLFLFLFVSG